MDGEVRWLLVTNITTLCLEMSIKLLDLVHFCMMGETPWDTISTHCGKIVVTDGCSADVRTFTSSLQTATELAWIV